MTRRRSLRMPTRLARALLVLAVAVAALPSAGCACRCTPLTREDDTRSFAFLSKALGAQFDTDVCATSSHVTGIPAALGREFRNAGEGWCTASELYGGCHER